MSDIRKWLKIMESVPATIADQPEKSVLIKKDATVMVNPKVGGGTARYMHSTPTGAMVDIKGIARELAHEDFSLPERDYEEPLQKGNDWFHVTDVDQTVGTQNDKPEFRAGDMVKIADVYGSVIGPGFGVFVAYGTTGKDCIVSFDNKEMIVPTANVGAVLEQNAKDNFDEMDNDGNLSPMSLGSENRVKEVTVTHKQETGMDHRDEFSKWMDTVEEAMTAEGKAELAEDIPMNECGCEQWDCPVCFPDDAMGMAPEMGELSPLGHEEHQCPACGAEIDDGHMHDDEEEFEIEFEDGSAGGMGAGGMAQAPEMEEDDDAISAFKAGGGQVTNLPYKGAGQEKRNAGKTMSSSHIGGVRGAQGDQPGRSRNASNPRNPSIKPVVGEEDDTDFAFDQKPEGGNRVRIGNLVIRSDMKSKSDGHESPLSFGDDNLDEQDMDGFDDATGEIPEVDADADPIGMRDYHQGMANDMDMDPNEREEVAQQIMNMQNGGMSMSDKMYDHETLLGLEAPDLRQVQQKVLGKVTETKPLKTATKSKHYLDDLDDLLNPTDANLPAEVGGSDDGEVVGGEPEMDLPVASRSATQGAMANRSSSAGMRDMMNRINQNAGEGEPDVPEQPQNELTIRTASDVPAVISQAMQAAGVQSPEWHTINNLPGYSQRNTRGMGRQVFSMFTSTPLENIKTIANVDGQGPNSNAEVNSVAAWLRDNAEDLGTVDVSHGMAIPGYHPDVKEYRANGIRFQVVRDPMGRYIYAYPDADARLQGGNAGQGQLQGGPQGGGDMPRLGESTFAQVMKPTLFEKIKWDQELDEAFIEESSLSKLIGKQAGGQALVKWLHKKHELGNDVNLEPQPFSERMLWKEFKAHPDNFVIVSAANGVAGVKPYKKFIDDRTAAFAKKGKQYNPSGDSTLPYQIIAFTDDGQQVDPNAFRQPTEPGEEPEERFSDPTVMKARMGKHNGKDMQNSNNTFNLLADKIGALRTVYQVTGGVERDKKDKRADMKKVPADNPQQAVQQIFQKVRPVLKTLVAQAVSQINNRAKRYIDGGNFEGAQKVAASGQKLKQLLVTLDTNAAVNVDQGYNSKTKELTSAVTKAIAQASGQPVNSDGYNSYAAQAAKGNSAQLRPILDALRDNLVGL